ncbi:MAG: DUF4252 domain-containing protein [Aeoliella sp.]
MYRLSRCTPGRFVQSAVIVAVAVSLSVRPAVAQTTLDSGTATVGEVAFDFADAPPATLEIDLGRGLIRDLLGLGDAAVAGFLEGLTTGSDPSAAENAEFIAQQLTSARELGDVVSEVVHEIHVRVYDGLPDNSQVGQEIAHHYTKALSEQGWESTVKIRSDNEMVRVFVHRSAESVQGVFVILAEGNDLVLANIIGDLSPEKVHQLTASATKIGVKLGLRKEIDKAIGELRRELSL